MKKKLVLIILLIIMVFSVLKIVNHFIEDNKEKNTQETIEAKIVKETDKNIKIPFNIDMHELSAQNKDIVGYLYFPNTNISYPLVQGVDNDYYLKKDINLEDSIWGTNFIDADADKYFNNNNTFIYGHSGIDSDNMFSDIKKFKDYDFFIKNHNAYLYTLDKIYLLDVYSMYQTDITDEVYYNEVLSNDDYQIYLNNTYNHSINKINNKPDVNTKIITISTCSFEDGNLTGYGDLRYLLHAGLTEIKN